MYQMTFTYKRNYPIMICNINIHPFLSIETKQISVDYVIIGGARIPFTHD